MTWLAIVLLPIYILIVAKTVQGFAGYEHRTPLSQTKYGLVRGDIRYSREGREYHSYTGIPYAQPPVGELRFKAPQPPVPWTFPYDARKETPVCIQKNYLFANPRVEGQEDCLYLNVFVPQVSEFYGRRSPLLPVMVFIHWGAFIAGRSTTGYLGPDFFMDKDVILVTFNYRLGPLGFLTTLDDNAPGNYALKDQVAALQWVQENIGNFGGDKDRVTIFGQSAGAGSVHYHLLSPLSKGLFHQAISQSGSALAPWARLLTDLQPNVTAAQATFVGCTKYIGDNKNLVECLRNARAEDIVDSQDNFKTFGVDPLIVYTPVVETESASNTPFFTKEPLQYIQDGEFHNVPWITGVVKNEGNLKAESVVRNSTLRTMLNADFETKLTELMGLSISTTNVTGLYSDIVEQYFGGKEELDIKDDHSIQGLIDVYTDRAFAYPMYQSVLLHGSKGHYPIWVYNFEYESVYSYGDLFASTNEAVHFHWGTSHCDDLLYLFKSADLFPDLVEENDLILSKLLIDIWTNFAIYGQPSPLDFGTLGYLTWEPIKATGPGGMKNENIFLLNITGSQDTTVDLAISKGFYKERMAFWSEKDLFENFPGLQ